MSDDTARDADDDTVLYIIPGDSVALCSRVRIEESNYGRSVTPHCLFSGRRGRRQGGGVGVGGAWAATRMAAIKAGSRKDADAEIYRYVYIPPPLPKKSLLRELGVYFVR